MVLLLQSYILPPHSDIDLISSQDAVVLLRPLRYKINIVQDRHIAL